MPYPSFSLIPPYINLGDIGDRADPTFADIDSDGDLDAFVGESSGNMLFYKNTGTITIPIFTDAVKNPFGLSDVGHFASPSLADIDGDGFINYHEFVRIMMTK